MCKADDLRPASAPRLPAEICRRCQRFVRPVQQSDGGPLKCPHCYSFLENHWKHIQSPPERLVSTG